MRTEENETETTSAQRKEDERDGTRIRELETKRECLIRKQAQVFILVIYLEVHGNDCSALAAVNFV